MDSFEASFRELGDVFEHFSKGIDLRLRRGVGAQGLGFRGLGFRAKGSMRISKFLK